MRNPLRRTKPKLSASKQALLASIKVQHGGHLRKRPKKGEKFEACVMELIGVMQHGVVTASPPCVAPSIRDLMIARNDYVDEAERQKLKKLAADVIHTAPTRYLSLAELEEYDEVGGDILVDTDHADLTYQELEKARNRRILAWRNPGRGTGTVPYKDFAKFVRELADMGRFPARPRGKKPPVTVR